MVSYLIDEKDPESTGVEAPFIRLYAATTGNNYKVSILLELLGLDYQVRKIDIRAGQQKEDWFLAINPNGRTPSLTDADKDGKVTHISESAAIMIYLADKYDKDRKYSYAPGTDLYYEELEWTFFQMAGLGPMGGQYNHFARFAPVKIDYAIERYFNETVRLFGVLEERLTRNKTGYLVGDRLGISDIVSYVWVNSLKEFGFAEEIKKLPRLEQWAEKISKIDAVKRGTSIFQ
ncbi:hypothetical protein CANARDRAFT_27614 [[Candida] arabinofermentans NRRL YB-2248]|uniref:Glutathione S-transferase n=1 Tax=[Candida] arabinofermentans NRRL YB-2248 TaxID=983967 RepID=A0A1E4T3T2_9ASCO|nr:hypothetical protein CANARDRAFT_27614 [[Candida] arabinofermentans NRRL YB-2248]